MIEQERNVKMDIIAHRGASKYAPENTLPAFQKALEQGAQAIELDVRCTKDGIPVICHDATINRTSNGKGYIHRLTLEQLKTYHFYHTFKKQFPNVTIPTLEEVLQLLQTEDVTLHVEIKQGPYIDHTIERKILTLIYKYDLENRVIYSSFDHYSLARIHRIDPQAKLGLLFHINLIDVFSYISRTNIPVYSLHFHHFYLTRDIVEKAHDRKMKVNGYTVNNRSLAKKYEELQIDGLMTDDPLILR